MTQRPRLTPAMADARRAVREQLESIGLPAGSLVLVACSGGGDSIALAAATAFEAPRMGFTAGAVIVDHQLQEGSGEVAGKAKQTCEELGLSPVIIEKVEVAITGNGMEAAARDARYQAFEKVRISQAADLVLLGHNLEDQAETVLLALARGSGLSALAGMDSYDPARAIARPLIGLSRSSLREACEDQGLTFWEDPHNQNPQFLRVRARRLLEQMEQELGPGIAKSLSRTAAQVSQAEEVLTGLAAELVAEAKVSGSASSVSYSVAKLSVAPSAVRTMALHMIAARAGARAISASQIEAIDALITNWHGQKSASLSGITVERVKDLLIFTRSKPPTPGAC
jgi:tRNA(Ile)-lysidine synthase